MRGMLQNNSNMAKRIGGGGVEQITWDQSQSYSFRHCREALFKFCSPYFLIKLLWIQTQQKKTTDAIQIIIK